MLMVSGAVLVRVEGKAEKAIYFSSASLAGNIILDFVLVNLLGGNLAGAAIATVIAQIIAAQLYINYFKNKSSIRITNFQ